MESSTLAAAVAVMSSCDITKMSSHGGYVNITNTWAKSLLKRMGYMKRKCPKTGKIPPAQFTDIQEAFLADINLNGPCIPDELSTGTKPVFHLSQLHASCW